MDRNEVKVHMNDGGRLAKRLNSYLVPPTALTSRKLCTVIYFVLFPVVSGVKATCYLTSSFWPQSEPNRPNRDQDGSKMGPKMDISKKFLENGLLAFF